MLYFEKKLLRLSVRKKILCRNSVDHAGKSITDRNLNRLHRMFWRTTGGTKIFSAKAIANIFPILNLEFMFRDIKFLNYQNAKNFFLQLKFLNACTVQNR